jgi:7-keto-8-aminopelargonate synthetase-like enzyme
MVDDAHGFGPLGANGGGIVEHFGLSQDDVPVLVGTLAARRSAPQAPLSPAARS